MARKPAQPPEPQKPNLLISRAKAEELIKKQIEKLVNLASSNTNLEQAKTTLEQLGNYNKELLGRIFDNDVIANEYNRAIY